MNDELTPVCEFERMSADDLLDAVKAIPAFGCSNGDILPPIGDPHDLYLEWALKEIDMAERAGDPRERQRFSTNALMHARRALSCLVDQYLLRDGFAYCKNPPSTALDKADTLVRRNLLDSLARGTLARAVDRRNDVEHQYHPAQFEQAADSVHYIRSTIDACVSKSAPFQATVIWGIVLGGNSYGANGETHWFSGWTDELFVIAHSAEPKWCGVVLPESGSKTNATVRRTPMREVSCGQLLDIHDMLDARCRNGGSYGRSGDNSWQDRLASLGLGEPL